MGADGSAAARAAGEGKTQAAHGNARPGIGERVHLASHLTLICVVVD